MKWLRGWFAIKIENDEEKPEGENKVSKQEFIDHVSVEEKERRQLAARLRAIEVDLDNMTRQ